ncbi:MAG: signal peptidase II [Bermanella sp.]|jgi:signal peptidase II
MLKTMLTRQLSGTGVLKWYAIAIVFVLLDQVTKVVAATYLSYGQPVYVLPVFNITLHYNTGAAFSFLSDAGGWQRWFFILVSTLVSTALIVWVGLIKNQQRLLSFALVMILAGAVGNLVDRVFLGYVVDFVSLHWNEYYFPAFNVADACITLGAGSMLLDMVLHPEDK